ncbi:MAG: peptide chain release factor aRF-1 [Candidatus Aenigmatarchaeota archaeon]
MVIKADSKRKLKELVEKLESIRGRGTELITIYCPYDYELKEIVNQLREEEAEAGNIKSKRTRKNVKSALSKMIDHLKEFKRTPDNGLAVFCGNVSQQEGKTDIQIWDIEPFEPVEIKLYRCGKEFKVEPLKDMLEEGAEYGMIVIDTNDADLGVLKGKRVVPKQHISSLVPGKSKPGGQSAARFERVREGLLEDYLKDVGEAAKQVFKEDELKGFIVGGPGPIKEKFIDGGYLPSSFEDKIVSMKSTSYTGEQGFEELLKKSREELKETELREEKELVQDVFDRLREDGKVAYGIEQVFRALKMGAVEKAVISEDLDQKRTKASCECGYKEEEIADSFEKKKCPECGEDLEIEEESIFDVIKEKAENTGATVELVSTDTSEGEQLYQMGGVAAFLRFKIE